VALGFGNRKQGDGERFRHNRAAYAREDVGDSKRGRPDFDLAGYANHRGMRFRGSIRMGAFMSASPIWPDYVFNAMDGALPSGRYGLIEHELDQQAIDQDGFDQGGGYHSVRTTYRNPEDWKSFLTYGLAGGTKETPNEPFAGNYAWLPASAVSIRVPEVNVIRPLDVRRKANYPRFGVTDLADFGLSGFRTTGLEKEDPNREVVADALSRGAGAALAACQFPYLRLEIGYGLVTLRRNGFATEEELGELVASAERTASAFADACLRRAEPQRFDAAVPAPAPGPELSKKEAALAEIVDGGLTQAGERIAAELGLEVEDPGNYHRAFMGVPMPGRARIVCRGTLPGTSAVGRLVYTSQGRRAGSTMRAGVLLEAAADASTELGGEVVDATSMYGEVADGIAACWDQGRVSGRPDAASQVERALATARELGIAAV